MIKFSELLKNIEILHSNSSVDPEISSVCYNSKNAGPGALFTAYKGALADGHQYIESAVAAGASAIIYDDPGFDGKIPDRMASVRTGSAHSALAHVSHAFFGHPTEKMSVIGVTGTNGKTTITYLLKAVFEAGGIKSGIIGTTGIYYLDKKFDTPNTTPESRDLAGYFAEMLSSGVTTAAVETSSHALEQGRTEGIHFSAGIFTNLTREHLDYHHTMSAYAEAKKILFDRLPEKAIAVIFDNSEYSDYMISDCKAKIKVFTGRTERSDYFIFDEVLGLAHTEFKIKNKSGAVYQLKTPLTGAFNIDNAAASFVCAVESGIDPVTAMKALGKCTGAPGRMERIALKNGAVGLVDYSHTPDAIEKALMAARDVLTGSTGGKLISVFGCGGDRDKGKRPLMGRISAETADYSIITDDNPRTEASEDIIKDITAGIPDSLLGKFEIIPDRRAAIRRAAELSKRGDIVIVCGKGHEDYQIIGKEKHRFDDREELKETGI